MLHAIAQLDGKAAQKKVRRAAESALGAPEGALDEKKAAVKEVCEDEMASAASASAQEAQGLPHVRRGGARAELKALEGREQEASARSSRGMRGAVPRGHVPPNLTPPKMRQNASLAHWGGRRSAQSLRKKPRGRCRQASPACRRA